MKIRCEHCSQEYEIDDTMLGKKVECTVCHKKYYVPTEEELFFNQNNIKENAIDKVVIEEEPEITVTDQASDHKGYLPKQNLNKKIIILAGASAAVIIVMCLVYLFFINNKKEEKIVKSNETAPVKVENSGVVCNTFAINAKIVQDSLELSLNTDLPGNTRIGLMVYRDCTGNDNKNYSVPYVRKNMKVEELRKNLKVSLSTKTWLTEYKNFINRMTRTRKDFSIKTFGDNITVYIYLGLEQENSSFGVRNSKLSGKAVVLGRYNTISSKIDLKFPLRDEAKVISDDKNPEIDIDNLKKDQVYIVSRHVPLYPEIQDKNTAIKIEDIKSIPEEGYFKVYSKTINSENVIWYNVEAYSKNDEEIGKGWINSITLARQKLTMIK